MGFLRLLFIGTKTSGFFSCLDVTCKLSSRTWCQLHNFGCCWWLGVMIPHCLAWRPCTALCHQHKDGKLVDIDVHRVDNIGQSTDPWDTPKDIFRYDYRVPLITADCLHWLKQDLNQSSAASLIPNSCSRCSCRVWSIVPNAADKSNRMRTTPLNVSTAMQRSFCTLSRAVSVLWVCFMNSAEHHGAHSE